MRPLLPLALSAVAVAGQSAWAISLPKDERLGIVRQECTRCHSLRNIANSEGKTRDEWIEHVIDMTDIENRPDNMQAVVDYLFEYFPPWEGQN
ncbi:hypothetical protein [Rhodovulum adriaticum]|uniref:Quinohemoprotein amine dehydrogenase alpha subunit haem binding domain-containing protein n=1 Tax=Rhodovulum adriaticum TaxID=35804 RepID=A0A4R2NIU1_RHOAD|nr:hypothetical protein [Rhodovulum adriaticum]MBK1635418.1 hypothetical protein [Rhodovulum adriaticum]TCP21125.1 hypothetical protein EV656_11346 [Rhodovulum adriaticum]